MRKEKLIVYCTDPTGLLSALGVPLEDHSKFRLFFDSNGPSFKAVLLSNGNKYAPVPLLYSTEFRECYQDMDIVLAKIRYNEFKWLIICDLKMTAILSGLQGGYPTYPCHLCEYKINLKNRLLCSNVPNLEIANYLVETEERYILRRQFFGEV